jgi:hypothetical protein
VKRRGVEGGDRSEEGEEEAEQNRMRAQKDSGDEVADEEAEL